MPGYTLSQFSIFDKFRDFVPWVSLDGFAVSGDVGYFADPLGNCVSLETTDVINKGVEIYMYEGWPKLLETGKVITVEFIIGYLSSITNQDIWLALASNLFADYFGWYISGKDLYALNYDVFTEKSTDTGVDLATGTQRTKLKMVFDPGRDIKFYVNDALKVTHTENLPSSITGKTNYFVWFSVKTLENASKNILLGRVLIEREN